MALLMMCSISPAVVAAVAVLMGVVVRTVIKLVVVGAVLVGVAGAA